MIKKPARVFGERDAMYVDSKNHILGKLAAVVAKHLLEGHYVVVVRCEGINISGHKHRNFINFQSYLNKHCNTNQNHGFHHHRAPGKIFKKAVRGMVPRKTKRGEEALSRLTVYEGIPKELHNKHFMSAPQALKHLQTSSAKFTSLLEISERF